MKVEQIPATATEVPYVDLPDLRETYVDQMRLLHFDGHAVRLEFVVTRHSVSGLDSVGTCHVPAARLVLPPIAAVHLYEQLNKLVTALETAGVLKRVPSVPSTKQ